MTLAKRDLLACIAQAGEVSAQDVAPVFGVRYSVAAMALLRLVRQGLATRRQEDPGGVYRYRLSDRGQARLAYLQQRVEGAGAIGPTGGVGT